MSDDIVLKILGVCLLLVGGCFVIEFVRGKGLNPRFLGLWLPFLDRTFVSAKRATFFQRFNLVMIGGVYVFFGVLLVFGNK